MNTKRRELGVQRFRKSLDCKFGGAVDAEAGRAAVAADRGDVEDSPGTPGTHIRQHRAGHGQEAEYVGSVETLDLLSGCFLDSAQQAVASVVEQHVDLPEARDS